MLFAEQGFEVVADVPLGAADGVFDDQVVGAPGNDPLFVGLKIDDEPGREEFYGVAGTEGEPGGGDVGGRVVAAGDGDAAFGVEDDAAVRQAVDDAHAAVHQRHA